MGNELKSVPKVRDIVPSRKAATPVEVRPLHDRVLVRRVPREATSKGGIIIPDTAKEKPQEGQVVAVGPGRRDDNGRILPMGVAKGDRTALQNAASIAGLLLTSEVAIAEKPEKRPAAPAAMPEYDM